MMTRHDDVCSKSEIYERLALIHERKHLEHTRAVIEALTGGGGGGNKVGGGNERCLPTSNFDAKRIHGVKQSTLLFAIFYPLSNSNQTDYPR